ncbi:MAG: FecR family protein, partial [Pseudomonadota bacterium]
MNLRTFPMAVILFLALVLALPQGASAEAVGHLTQVQGRVDLLKGGKLPATPVKVGDGVEEGDVLRAKSLSKAQITFVDQTTLTMSPESRIAIEKFMFDGAKGKRNAVLQMFQGLALFVVSKIHQTEQPDFVVKTHTAIMGIRGTEVGIRLQPNESTFLTFSGLIRVSSNFAEISGYVDGKA